MIGKRYNLSWRVVWLDTAWFYLFSVFLDILHRNTSLLSRSQFLESGKRYWMELKSNEPCGFGEMLRARLPTHGEFLFSLCTYFYSRNLYNCYTVFIINL